MPKTKTHPKYTSPSRIRELASKKAGRDPAASEFDPFANYVVESVRGESPTDAELAMFMVCAPTETAIFGLVNSNFYALHRAYYLLALRCKMENDRRNAARFLAVARLYSQMLNVSLDDAMIDDPKLLDKEFPGLSRDLELLGRYGNVITEFPPAKPGVDVVG